MPDNIAEDLASARAWIGTAGPVLQAASPDEPEIRRAVARQERMEAEVAKVEGVVAAAPITQLQQAPGFARGWRYSRCVAGSFVA